MKGYYGILIITNMVILLIVGYNIYSFSAHKYIPSESTEIVQYYDLGCENSELEQVNANSSVYFICKDIGALCEVACQNVSDAKVQASMGKGNTVTCRCVK
jgi:hypothetical protein